MKIRFKGVFGTIKDEISNSASQCYAKTQNVTLLKMKVSCILAVLLIGLGVASAQEPKVNIETTLYGQY